MHLGTPVISQLCGVGSALPKKCVLNDDLPDHLGTSDEWIKRRTGIAQRFIADVSETSATLGAEAAQKALSDSGLSTEDIDLIIVATATPDNTFPSTATKIQNLLGINHGAAFDVQAVCTGFVYALSVGDAMIRSGQATGVIVIGAETFSRILDWQDRSTCVLFGDGAGAIVMRAKPIHEEDAMPRGVLANYLRADGQHRDKLYVDGGVSTNGVAGHLRMNGKEVFKLAVRLGCEVIDNVLDKTSIKPEQIDWLVPHQANYRIISSIADHYGMPMEKVILTVSEHANTSAASVPLALDVGVKSGKIKQGDIVLLEAMGGGFTWGASLVRW